MTQYAYDTADAALMRLLERWNAVESTLDIGPNYRPRLSRTAKGEWKFYGCGEWGCAMPTHDAAVTLKLTSDPHEALAMHVIQEGHVLGFAQVHAVAALPMPKRRMVYAIWRSAIADPGLRLFGRGNRKAEVATLSKRMRLWDSFAEDVANALEELAETHSPKTISLRLARPSSAGSLERAATDSIGQLTELSRAFVLEDDLGSEIGRGLGDLVRRGAIPLDLHRDNLGMLPNGDGPVVFDARIWAVGDSFDHLQMRLAW